MICDCERKEAGHKINVVNSSSEVVDEIEACGECIAEMLRDELPESTREILKNSSD